MTIAMQFSLNLEEGRNSNRPDCKYDFNKPPKHKKKFGRVPEKEHSETEMDVEDLGRAETLLGEVLQLLKHKEESFGQVREKMREMSKKNGILRVAIPSSFSFEQSDLDEFFSKYGKIEKIKIFKGSEDQAENTAFIFYSSHYSAILALRVLQSIPESDIIVKGKVCLDEDSSEEIYVENGRLGLVDEREFILFLEGTVQEPGLDHYTTFQHPIVAEEIVSWKYCCLMGVDIEDKKFNVKDRILGVRCANFLRVYCICEKTCACEERESRDFELRLIMNKRINSENEVLVISNSLEKYRQAKSLLQELLAQIIEEYKNCMDKSFLPVKRDIHLRIAEKMNMEPELRFLDSK